jgi:sigma-E factor negative regulatory protein RseC
MEETIDYCGTVVGVDNDKVYVRVAPKSACSGCRIQSACMTAKSSAQTIETPNPQGKVYKIGEAVTLSLRESYSIQAALWAFVVPLALLIAAIAIASGVGLPDSDSAMAGLGVLPVYYVILYLMRGKFRKKFVFQITQPVETNIDNL